MPITQPKKIPVDLPAERQPLIQALQIIAQQAGIHLVYADELLADIEIEKALAQVPCAKAIKLLLKETPITARWVRADRVVFVAQKPNKLIDLYGQVSDANGLSLAGARVSIQGSSRVAITDAKGIFRLVGLPKKRLTVIVKMDGFRTEMLKLGKTYQGLTITLEPAPHVSEYYAVQTTQTLPIALPETAMPLILKPEDLEDGVSRDLFENLAHLPSMSQTPGQGGVAIRGSQPSENLVLLNDIKLYHADHAMGHFSSINPDAIESVTLFTSGVPARYGDRTAGVLDMRSGDRVGGTFTGVLGLEADIAALSLYQPLGSKGSLSASARHSLSQTTAAQVFEQLFQNTFSEEPETSEDEVELSRRLSFADFLGTLNYKLRPNLHFRMSWYQGEDRNNETISEEDEEYSDKDGEWGNKGWSVSVQKTWEKAGTTHLVGTYSQFESDFLFFSDENLSDELPGVSSEAFMSLKDRSFQLSHQVALGADHELQVGYMQTSIANKIEDQEQQKTQLEEIFAEDLWQPGDRWQIRYGLRGSRNQLSETEYLDPRLSFTYRASDQFNLRGSLGRYHQHSLRVPDALTFFEGTTSWYLADEDIKPIEATEVQTGIQYGKGLFAFDLAIYFKEMKGSLLQGYDVEDFGLRQATVEVPGLDFMLQMTKGPVEGRLAYSYQQATVVEDWEEEEVVDYPTSQDQPHRTNLLFAYKKQAWQLNLVWVYSSGRPYGIPELVYDEGELILGPSQVPNEHRLPSIHQLNVGAKRNFKIWRIQGQLGLSIRNAYDQNNTLFQYFDIEDEEVNAIAVPDFGLRVRGELRLRF